MKAEMVEAEGIVTNCHRGGTFTIVLDGAKAHQVIGHLNGRMRKNHIRILLEDRVRVELSPYSMDLCRITYRYIANH